MSAPPTLLLLKGQPGSGKSALAHELARLLAWPVLDKDDIRDAFEALLAANASLRGALDWNELSYAVLFSLVGAQLRHGLSCILDCPLARRQLFDRAGAAACEHRAALALIECEPGDEQAWRARLEARGQQDASTPRAHKPGSWSQLESILERNAGSEHWSSAEGLGLACHVRLDTSSAGPTQLAAAVVARLREAGLGAS